MQTILVILLVASAFQSSIMMAGLMVALRVLGHVKKTNGRVLDYDEIPLTGISTESERAKLLKFHRRIEEAVRSQKRAFIFLSIDVVASTEMKRGSREIAIQSSFASYEHMVKRCLAENHVWKSCWTPDGIMAAFRDADEAFEAARCVLKRLKRFNERINTLKDPFRVRCGIAHGEVVIFEDSELEKVADSAIDFAGHLQKSAPPNAIFVATIAHIKITKSESLVKWEGSVDGKAVYIYREEEENEEDISAIPL